MLYVGCERGDFFPRRRSEAPRCDRSVGAHRTMSQEGRSARSPKSRPRSAAATPNLPTNISYPYTKICRLNNSQKFPMDVRMPPLKIKILLESNPQKSRILVRRLTVAFNCSIQKLHPEPRPLSLELEEVCAHHRKTWLSTSRCDS